jgi:hypothetical protein
VPLRSILFALLLLTPVFTHAARSEAEMPRVRASDPWISGLLASGYADSSTFRAIVDRVQRSDVIVHVETMHQRRDGVSGTLRFVTRAGGARYLRIAIAMPSARRPAIALLGHELEHASEVADDDAVVDHASFEALYRRIADRCGVRGTARSYDTRGARAAGDRIFAELHKRGPQAAAD